MPCVTVFPTVKRQYSGRSSDPEAASHFVYPIRHNPLNRKKSFLISLLSSTLRSRLHCPSWITALWTPK
jgi:hypothetical protein